jgi:hypothetical protein
MSVIERAARYLERVEPSVSGCVGHNKLLCAAGVLVNGFALSVEESKPLLRAYFNPRCEPPWPERELDRKLKVALTKGCRKGRGYLLGANADIPAPESVAALVSSAPSPRWPAPDLDTIDRIVRTGPGAYDAWEDSLWRWEDEASHAEEIIDHIFPGDPLLCCGWASWNFETRRRSAWHGLLSEMPLIVPNPMVSKSGLTMEGKESQHTLEATSKRIYQVVEFDFSPTDRNGTPTVYAPLLARWRADGISTLDACAALSAHLARRLPSWVLFLDSGGKSGHAWFNVRGLPNQAQREFFSQAVRLGADAQLWTRSQFVRMPDGHRENGRQQSVFYFNPQNAIHESPRILPS